MDYVERVIRRIRLTGLPKAEIARRAEISAKTVERFMARKHSPNLSTMDKIEHVLDEWDQENGQFGVGA